MQSWEVRRRRKFLASIRVGLSRQKRLRGIIARRYYEDHEGPQIPAHERRPWGLPPCQGNYLVTHEPQAWRPALDRSPAGGLRPLTGSLAALPQSALCRGAGCWERALPGHCPSGALGGPVEVGTLPSRPGAAAAASTCDFLPLELYLWRHRRHAGAVCAPRTSVRASACREGPPPWQSEQDREQDARTALAVRASAGSPPGPPGFTFPAPRDGTGPNLSWLHPQRAICVTIKQSHNRVRFLPL